LGDVFGDQVVASAMIDRIIHQVEVITLKDSSYRLKHTQVDSLPSTRPEATAEQSAPKWLTMQPARQLTLRPALKGVIRILTGTPYQPRIETLDGKLLKASSVNCPEALMAWPPSSVPADPCKYI
jgi:hypothetical protein